MLTICLLSRHLTSLLYPPTLNTMYLYTEDRHQYPLTSLSKIKSHYIYVNKKGELAGIKY